MARRMQRLDAHATDAQYLAIRQPKVGIGCRTETVHDHRHAQPLAHFPAGRKVVGVGVGIDEVAYAQAIARRHAQIVIDLRQGGIDHHGRVALAAAQDVGLAAAGGYLLENHAGCLVVRR